MNKKRTYLITFFIFVLVFLAGNLVYPAIKNSFFPEVPFKLGLDLQGGTHLIYQADLSNIADADKSQSMEGLRNIIERRVNLFGVKEPLVQVEGSRLIVDLAGVVDPAEAIKQIGQTPFLEFKEQKPDDIFNKIMDMRKQIEGKSQAEIEKIPDWQLANEDPFQDTPLTGKYLQKATLNFDQTTYKPVISLQFNDEGAKLFEEITTRNVGKMLAVYLDNQLTQAPVVKEAITGGKAQITGDFSVDEAKKRVQELNAGALPVPINLLSQQSVGPTLGAASLDQSLKAGIYGFIAIIIFMILFYRLPGLLASIALGVYIIFVLTLFKIIPVTLTLAGIAGFLLSIGMAVDANILIFSRMREEMAQGKNFNASVEEGFNRAWPSIRDSNSNTLIVSVILFWFATSFIKGFALTLSVGVLISMLSAIFITRTFLRCFVGTKLEKVNWLWK